MISDPVFIISCSNGQYLLRISQCK